MPPRPRPLQRMGLVLLSLGLPALVLGVTAACLFVLTSMGNHDRALAWVSGSPAQLSSLARAVESHPVFRHGRVQAGAFEAHRPDACAPSMVSASFSRLHDYEVLVAKATLDQLVRESGAVPCRAHAFVFNDLPNPLDPGEWNESVAMMLLMLLIPSGSLLVAYWSCSGQFGLPPLRAGLGAPGRMLLAGLGTGALALAWVAGVHGLASLLGGVPFRGPAMPSYSLAMLAVVALYAPFLEEVAFRAWLVPIASRALGQPAAIALSASAYAAVHWSAGMSGVLSALGVGALLAGLFVRTRSLPACLVAHGAYNAAALAWHAASAA